MWLFLLLKPRKKKKHARLVPLKPKFAPKWEKRKVQIRPRRMVLPTPFMLNLLNILDGLTALALLEQTGPAIANV